jgi:tRNA threonylcarbamoyladenosine biosynthesis protein TsaE
MLATDHNFLFPTEIDTANWAAKIAPLLRAGDTILLSGEIGAGKSAFARALIRARLARMEDVPSPTFTIVQTYQADDVEIWHCDLYRLTHPDEAYELGLEDAFKSAICLVEWPDRLGDEPPEDALSIAFSATADGHQMTLSANSEWQDRLAGIL